MLSFLFKIFPPLIIKQRELIRKVLLILFLPLCFLGFTATMSTMMIDITASHKKYNKITCCCTVMSLG